MARPRPIRLQDGDCTTSDRLALNQDTNFYGAGPIDAHHAQSIATL